MLNDSFQDVAARLLQLLEPLSGIGKTSSLLLSKQGIKVVLTGRDEQAGKALQQEIIST